MLGAISLIQQIIASHKIQLIVMKFFLDFVFRLME